MKIENIPADIKSKSIKETRDEIDKILSKLEKQDTNLDQSIGDYQRLILLNKIKLVISSIIDFYKIDFGSELFLACKININ